MWLPFFFFFFLFLTERSYLAAPKAAGPAVRSQASDGRIDSARLSRVDATRRLPKKKQREARAGSRAFAAKRKTDFRSLPRPVSFGHLKTPASRPARKRVCVCV